MPNEIHFTDIVVPRSAFDSDDPFSLVQANIDALNVLFDRGQFLSHEVPRAAVLSYQVDYWSAQVCNGGHGQFYGNSVEQPATFDWVEQGLAAMGADAYAEVFARFRTLIASDSERAARIAEGSGFGDIDPEIRRLDDAFFARGSAPLLALNNAFLRGQQALNVVPDADLAAALTERAARNPHAAARRAEALAQRAAIEAADPTYLAARALCDRCGIAFECLTAGRPEAGGSMLWGMETSSGSRMMRLDDNSATLFASLAHALTKQPLAHIAMVDSRPERPGIMTRLRRLFGL